jgi:hypothetical protein
MQDTEPFLPGQIVAARPLQAWEADPEIIGKLPGRNDDLPISHYIPLHRFRQLLQDRCLHLKRLDQYVSSENPEGFYPAANLDPAFEVEDWGNGIRVHRNRRGQQAMQEAQNLLRYIHCWFNGIQESAHMWEKFGDEGRGLCIRSTPMGLLKALEPVPAHLSIEIREVCLRDENERLSDIHSSNPAFRKLRSFVAEAEVRLLAKLRRSNETPEFQKLPIAPALFIHGLVTGPAMAREDREKILADASRHIPSVCIHDSELPRGV